MAGLSFFLKLLCWVYLLPTTFAIDFPNQDVLIRLSTVETAIATIQKVNKDLRLENRKLRVENVELKTRIVHVETEFQSHKEELVVMKERLAETERYIAISRPESREENLTQNKEPTEEANVPFQPSKETEVNSTEENDELEMAKVLTNRRQKFRKRIKDKIGHSGENRNLRDENLHRRNGSKRLLMPVTTTSTDLTTGSRISFSAHTDEHLLGLGIEQALKFSIVNNNEGGAYDKLSGMFVCPISGTYFFTATIFSFHNEEIYASITVNNNAKSLLGADGSSTTYGSGSNSVIIHCSKGEHVWIRHEDPNHGSKVYGGRYSHFGGFLLWSDDI